MEDGGEKNKQKNPPYPIHLAESEEITLGLH